MKTACFNLVDNPWLPVTLGDGFPNGTERGPLPRVSLREAFEHGDTIVDLRCYPHERIALMRLLICIAQRALNGPKDEHDWKTSGQRLAHEAVAYLGANRECLELFGNTPFLQAHGAGKPGQMTVSRLVLIDKDTPVLFDAHIEPGTSMELGELAVALVTYQSFAAGGKVGGSEPSPKNRRTKAGIVKMEPQSGEAALCRDSAALHALILGANLSETIHWNLLCRSQIVAPMRWGESDRPVWEYGKTDIGELPASEIKVGYLGRLVPLGRAVWLHEDRTKAEIANGVQYGVFADSKDSKTKRTKSGTGVRELTASVEPDRRAQGQYRLVSASAGDGVPKAAWRELHSIAVLRRSGKRGGPVALEHLRTLPVQVAILWCGALVGNQARVGDVIESTFRLPAQFFEDADAESAVDPRKCPGANQTYREGVQLAENWARRLKKAVSEYHLRLSDDFSKRNNADRGRKVKTQAALRYWTALEQTAERVLLHDVALNSGKYWIGDRKWVARSPWGQEVWCASHEAYEYACPHNTPRQLRAYAAGLAMLHRENRAKAAVAGQSEDDDESTEGGEG